MATTQKERTALLDLRQKLQEGETVYTILKHVSRSGMYRVIDLYIMRDNKPQRITYDAAQVIGRYDRKHEGLGVGGAGMDMGFHVVYSLAASLWGIENGYALEHRWL